MQHTLIPERLAEQRKKLNINKLEASKLLNMTQATYCRYELGVRNPTITTVTYMAQRFGTNTDYLVGRSDDPSPEFIILAKKDNPVLFEIVSTATSYDEKQMKLLSEYASQLLDQK